MNFGINESIFHVLQANKVRTIRSNNCLLRSQIDTEIYQVVRHESTYFYKDVIHYFGRKHTVFVPLKLLSASTTSFVLKIKVTVRPVAMDFEPLVYELVLQTLYRHYGLNYNDGFWVIFIDLLCRIHFLFTIFIFSHFFGIYYIHVFS